MRLTTEDAKLYFELTCSWQFFVNRKTNTFQADTVEDYQDFSAEEKMTIRDLCYERLDLLDEYLTLNPDNFNAEKLAIISRWRNPVIGDFHIERYLKKYAIFIAQDDTVYAVLGLYDGFDEMLHKSHLPRLCKTSLLPFKGKIVYDGLMQHYSVYFGGGIKSSLKDVYMKAKLNGNIIDSFDVKPKESKKKAEFKGYNKEITALKKISKTLRGGANQPVLNSPTFSLLKAAIELSEQTLEQETDYQEIYKAIRKLDRARNKLVKILDLME